MDVEDMQRLPNHRLPRYHDQTYIAFPRILRQASLTIRLDLMLRLLGAVLVSEIYHLSRRRLATYLMFHHRFLRSLNLLLTRLRPLMPGRTTRTIRESLSLIGG